MTMRTSNKKPRQTTGFFLLFAMRYLHDDGDDSLV